MIEEAMEWSDDELRAALRCVGAKLRQDKAAEDAARLAFQVAKAARLRVVVVHGEAVS